MDKPEIVTRLERLSDAMADCVIKDLPTTQADAMNALDRAAQVIAACVGALEAVIGEECIGSLSGPQQFFRDNEHSRAAIRQVRAALTLARSKP